MTPVKIYRHNGVTLKIFQDETPDSPREWYNIGTLDLYHSRYDLPRESGMSAEALKEYLEENAETVIAVQVRGYDHGGLSIQANPGPGSQFYDRWDSGMLGYVWCTLDKVKKEYGDTSPESREKARGCMISEVEVYDQYLTGQCWGYVRTGPGDEEDSCWGFFGEDAEKVIREAGYLDEELFKHPITEEELTRQIREQKQNFREFLIRKFGKPADNLSFEEGMEKNIRETMDRLTQPRLLEA